MKHYLFCLRHFNDIDNITPAIHFLLERRPVRVTVLIYSLDYDYRKDPSLLFLRQTWENRVSVVWLGALAGCSSSIVFSFKSNYWSYIWRQMVNIKDEKKSDSLRKPLEKIFGAAGVPETVVFDQNRTPVIAGLLAALRQSGVSRIISLPVSPWININVLRDVDLIDVNAKKFRKKHDYSGFDAIGQVDSYYRDNLRKFYSLLGDPAPFLGRERILGAIRYTDEWLRIRRDNFRYFSLGGRPKINSNERRRLLILPSHRKNNSFWEEYIRTLRFLCQFEMYEIVVKPHTRYGRGYKGLPQKIKLAPDLDTSALIDWADIVLFWSTSVALEAFQKRKMMVNLDYINGNKSIFTLLGAGYLCRCRDDLLAVLSSETEMNNALVASAEGRERLRRSVIGGGSGGEVIDRYLDFCEGD